MEETKEEKLKRIEELQKKHDGKREELLKILQAMELLESQYKEISTELYSLEDEYVRLMKEITLK
jgi:uncharacterized protein (DUF3084 family)